MSISIVKKHTIPLREGLPKKMPVTNYSDHSFNILLVARDQIERVFTDEVLRQAGFQLRSVSPWEARALINDGGSNQYSLVVLSHTLFPEDVFELGKLVRRFSPASKVLLLRGVDHMAVDRSLYDSALEALEGPAALIRQVRNFNRRASAPDGAADGHATISA